jgi:hypothetical protein
MVGCATELEGGLEDVKKVCDRWDGNGGLGILRMYSKPFAFFSGKFMESMFCSFFLVDLTCLKRGWRAVAALRRSHSRVLDREVDVIGLLRAM